jgi:hypothetical protein
MMDMLYGIIPFDRPATYQIRVQGRIDPNWSDRMAGMQVRISKEQTTPPITILYGEVSDQAALLGVLNLLYELHLPIVAVAQVPHLEGKEKQEL